MHGFQTTRWSLIETARSDPPHARDALESVCHAYRPPVLAYVRRNGYDQAEAEDLTQDFFVDFLRRGWYAQADPRHGCFRALLLVTLGRFLIDRHAQAGARKRGGTCTRWRSTRMPCPTTTARSVLLPGYGCRP